LQAEHDPFWSLVQESIAQSGAKYRYEELDPDIFASELGRPAYAEAERIAAVLLHATLGNRKGSQVAAI
jgi:hypothetical protein